ncbi:hypothetical protein [Halodesulfovibrio sp.]|nr:hypothetical protein [Halodesulfovibrio sp.]MCT4627919.1 hypothetical protein [Halodesulfovibrio sp.]
MHYTRTIEGGKFCPLVRMVHSLWEKYAGQKKGADLSLRLHRDM